MLQFGDSYSEAVQKLLFFWKQLQLIKLPAKTPIYPNLERHFAITNVWVTDQSILMLTHPEEQRGSGNL